MRRRNNKFKRMILGLGFLGACMVAALLVSGGTAQASATFQGVTFTFLQLDANTLTFELKGTPSGDWAGVQFLGAFDFKDLGLDFSTVSGTANGPGAVGLVGQNAQLSAASPDCVAAGSPPGSICFDISPDKALGALPFDFLYTIDFSSNLNIASTGVHLQIVFTDTAGGDKVGSLYSQDVPLGDGGGGHEVPEPSALILLGAGLVALSCVARRFNRAN